MLIKESVRKGIEAGKGFVYIDLPRDVADELPHFHTVASVDDGMAVVTTWVLFRPRRALDILVAITGRNTDYLKEKS